MLLFSIAIKIDFGNGSCNSRCNHIVEFHLIGMNRFSKFIRSQFIIQVMVRKSRALFSSELLVCVCFGSSRLLFSFKANRECEKEESIVRIDTGYEKANILKLDILQDMGQAATKACCKRNTWSVDENQPSSTTISRQKMCNCSFDTIYTSLTRVRNMIEI